LNYIIESKFSIGDIVTPKLNTEDKYYIIGYEILSADKAGNVSNFVAKCSSGTGNVINMYEYELELREPVEN